MNRNWRLNIGAATLALLTGCAAGNMVRDAKTALAQAEAAGAKDRAAYEYTAAEEYLNMAQHELDELDSAAARNFAEKSAGFSAQAIARTQGGAR